ncbi:MAG: 2-dehydropantoate 2-reductase, partial [Anaerolineales bacterium]|nr:2-dehydropantoate 2-reductase [Anaerolineales bacterium]
VALQASEIRNTKTALVLVKSWQTERAARQLSQILDPDGIVLTLQNGLGNLEILSSSLGEERVAQGVTTCGATLIGPGLVRPAGEGVVSIQAHPRLNSLTKTLKKAGFAIKVVPDLNSLVWEKLIVNVAINPLTAILGIQNGKLLESQSAVNIMTLAAIEATEVAKAKGIPLYINDPGQEAQSVALATSNNLSSMLQDINRGAPTEIDFLCGAVTRIGRSMNVPTPVNHLLWQLIKSRVELTG